MKTDPKPPSQAGRRPELSLDGPTETFVRFRCPTELLGEIRQSAKLADLTLSEWCRRTIKHGVAAQKIAFQGRKVKE